eukprot:scpid60848/ scgid10589/ 
MGSARTRMTRIRMQREACCGDVCGICCCIALSSSNCLWTHVQGISKVLLHGCCSGLSSSNCLLTRTQGISEASVQHCVGALPLLHRIVSPRTVGNCYEHVGCICSSCAAQHRSVLECPHGLGYLCAQIHNQETQYTVHCTFETGLFPLTKGEWPTVATAQLFTCSRCMFSTLNVPLSHIKPLGTTVC